MSLRMLGFASLISFFLAAGPAAERPQRIIRANLAYQAPGQGPQPDFSAAGTQVKLTDVPADARLPEGASRPAKSGTMQIGPDERSWIRILATADAA